MDRRRWPVAVFVLTAAGLAVALTMPALTLPAMAAPRASAGWEASYTSPYEPPASHPAEQLDPGLFTSVAAISPDDVLAAGFDYAGGSSFDSGKPVIEHWDGQSWEPFNVSTLPASVRDRQISDIAARSTSDVWLVSPASNDGTPAVVTHWDGSAWSSVTSTGLPMYWSGQFMLRGATTWLVGSGSDDPAFATSSDGEAFIATYRGSGANPHWEAQRFARLGALNAGYVRSAKDAWAVGSAFAGQFDIAGRSLVEHWDGKRWHRLASPGPQNLIDVAAASKHSVVVIGAHSVRQWNGRRWHRVAVPKHLSRLAAVTTDPAGGYWVSGAASSHRTHAAYYRLVHERWQVAVGPARTLAHGGAKQNVAINEMATAADSVWAVGVDAAHDCAGQDGCPDFTAGAPIVDRRLR